MQSTFEICFLLTYLNLLDLYNDRLVYKDVCKLVNKNPRYKKDIEYSINIISNKEWFENITATLDKFTNTLKTDIMI